MTHRGDKSTEACILYTRMVYLLTEAVNKYQDGNVADFLHECLKGTFYDASVEKPATYAAGGYVVDSMCTAVSCLAHAQTFEEAVCAAANLGGDTDTNAAITGGLAGAWFGFSAIRRAGLEPWPLGCGKILIFWPQQQRATAASNRRE